MKFCCQIVATRGIKVQKVQCLRTFFDLCNHSHSIVTLHKRILKSAGLNYINFYALRHTFATAALQKWCGRKNRQQYAGSLRCRLHRNLDEVQRCPHVYTHATRQKQEQAAEKMGNFMDKVM